MTARKDGEWWLSGRPVGEVEPVALATPAQVAPTPGAEALGALIGVATVLGVIAGADGVDALAPTPLGVAIPVALVAVLMGVDRLLEARAEPEPAPSGRAVYPPSLLDRGRALIRAAVTPTAVGFGLYNVGGGPAVAAIMVAMLVVALVRTRG